MTKAEVIEQVFIAMGGGKLSVDNDIQRADIRNYFSAAYGYAALMYNRQARKDSIEDIAIWGSGGSGTVEHALLTTVKKPVSEDADRDLLYIALTAKAKLLPGNRGVEYVYPVKGEYNYVRINSPSEVIGLPMGNTTYYWYEDSKVYLKNLGKPLCDHYVRYIMDPAGLDLEDEVPLPLGAEYDCIRLMTEFMTGQRSMPADMRINDNDETNDISQYRPQRQ